MADPLAFPWTEQRTSDALRTAVRAYWKNRTGQSKRQRKLGVKDMGTRAEVTGGQHLNSVIQILCEVALGAGFKTSEIQLKAGIELPGYFRPQKKWDLVIVRKNRLCAALELKSQAGSFGNNFNNRSEEAIGCSTDFWTAFREGALGAQAPWAGYFFLLEKADKSTRPVALKQSVFPAFPVFHRTSYADRYSILCERLVLERKYTSAAFVLASRSTSGEYSEPNPNLGFHSFARSLHGHLVGCT